MSAYFEDIISKPRHLQHIRLEQSIIMKFYIPYYFLLTLDIIDGQYKIQDVIDHIESLIGMEEDLNKILKLLCLVSLIENGIKDTNNITKVLGSDEKS